MEMALIIFFREVEQSEGLIQAMLFDSCQYCVVSNLTLVLILVAHISGPFFAFTRS
jgi:hypothetical protein